MSKIVGFCLVLSTFVLSAQALLLNGDFEEGGASWRLPSSGAEVVEHGGYNGTHGLHVWRDDPEQYSFPLQTVNLEVGRLYQLGLWTKGEGCNRATASYGVEYYSAENKWLGGAYNIGPQQSSFDWTYCEVTACPPVGTDYCQVVLYLEKGGTGHVWFDNVTLSNADREPDVFLVWPLQGQLRSSGEVVRVRLAKLGGDRPDFFAGWSVRLTFGTAEHFGAVSQTLRGDEERGAAFHLPKLPVGEEITLKAEVLNPEGAVVNAVERNSLVMETPAPPAGACIIDEKGRAFVDGKPFLPIGLYLSDLRNPDDLARLMGSPFNCFMPYHSIGLALPGQQKPPYTIEKIRALLDVVHRNGKKIIFSVKDFFPTAQLQNYVAAACKQLEMPDATPEEMVERLVTGLRDHPAILAWYLNDEISLSKVEMVNDRRKLLNRLDPWHPSWGVLCDFNEASYFANACDVFGVDPYPLGKKMDPRTQQTVVTAMEAFADSGLAACWCVPQLFNWGTYQARRKPETYPEFVEPSEDEMRAMTLLMAIRGAKGFIYYSDFDLKRPTDPNSFNPAVEPPETFANRWHDICEVARLLQELAPFLLSDQPSFPIPCKMLEGKAEARIFRNDAGEIRVLIAAIGPGPVKARFSLLGLPFHGEPRSRFGKCTLQSDGAWLFEGTDITCDVME
ncbi:MAG: carbohydrate binding domain-containing protein [Victivallales bacterium]|nr:carbohydrate binding domain-containing protein [Victivallales bacterium]